VLAHADPRGREIAVNNLRSINLNISSRGYAAVASVDAQFADALIAESIPMPSRLIHHLDGRTEAQLYDPLRGNCSNSIHRGLLNQRMVEALPDEVEVRFNTKLARVEFGQRSAHGVRTKRGEPTLLDSPPETPQIPVLAKAEKVDAEFDLIVGADGSWSKVRQEMMRAERIDFSQSFIPHAYIELHMEADASKPGGFAMPPNHLHIWPRHKFMLIALPNKDGSFTLTLFIPFDELHALSTPDDARAFFQKHFRDAWDIVGEKLVDDFMEHPRGNLVTINVTPSTYSSHAVLMGDACHSMVP
jgi:kynurenine 3-monooxygenase